MIVMSNWPSKPRGKPSKAQVERRSLFEEAVFYAQRIKGDPKKSAAYKKKLKGRRSVYHAAISDYMKENKSKGKP